MKQIEGFKNYAVTECGRVFNTSKETERAQDFNKAVGYFQVDLYEKNQRTKHYIHRLVAQAYVPNPNKLPEVNHKDSNRTNNHYSNLEWVTSSGNSLHAVAAGQRDHVPRMQQPDIEKAYALVMAGSSYKEVSEVMDNSWQAGFLSVKVGRYAQSIGEETQLKAELKRQRIARSAKNLEAINGK